MWSTAFIFSSFKDLLVTKKEPFLWSQKLSLWCFNRTDTRRHKDFISALQSQIYMVSLQDELPYHQTPCSHLHKVKFSVSEAYQSITQHFLKSTSLQRHVYFLHNLHGTEPSSSLPHLFFFFFVSLPLSLAFRLN